MKRLILTITILLLVTILYPAGFALASETRWYAGYCYRDPPGGWGPFGVRSKIYTIDPYVPQNEFLCQWVTVVLSYDKKYWIQLGYDKNPPDHGVLFYWEVYDDTGYVIEFISDPTPIAGEYYLYLIVSLEENELYKLHIYETYDSEAGLIWQREISVDPHSAVDLQAFSETTTSDINIDGTHFNGLRYYYAGRNWRLWDRHVPHADDPYWVYEISDYEFYAYRTSGGGEEELVGP